MRMKIKTPTGKVTKATIDAVMEVITLEAQITTLQNQAKGLKDKIKEGIEAQHLGSISTEKFGIVYKASTARNSINTKQLKIDNPKLYKKYLKTSSVASSITIKPKEQ